MDAVRYKTEKYIKLDGKVFTRRFHFATKGQASTYAKSLRSQGKLARIVPHKGVYTVYSADGRK